MHAVRMFVLVGRALFVAHARASRFVSVLQLDSFALWLLHRKIRFTANNFFTVDLTLVYAVST